MESSCSQRSRAKWCRSKRFGFAWPKPMVSISHVHVSEIQRITHSLQNNTHFVVKSIYFNVLNLTVTSPKKGTACGLVLNVTTELLTLLNTWPSLRCVALLCIFIHGPVLYCMDVKMLYSINVLTFFLWTYLAVHTRSDLESTHLIGKLISQCVALTLFPVSLEHMALWTLRRVKGPIL